MAVPATDTPAVPATDPVVDLLDPAIRNDKVLNHVLGDGFLWSANERARPSGLDQVACAIARNVLTGRQCAVALALPRGRHPLPALLGLYLAAWRVVLGRATRELHGSVAVSSSRTELRGLVPSLVFDGSDFGDAVPAARLVSQPLANKRVRAAALPLGGGKRKGLSTTDAFLLFMLPNRMPPVTLNVISAMVCDTYGASPTSWQTTRERNVAAKRREVWLGELGDGDFEAFCAEQRIPLVRCDWSLIAAAATRHGIGASRLATTACCERALAAPALGYHVVSDEDVDTELRELTFSLAEMRRLGRAEPPDPIKFAGQLANLLARLASPVSFYDQAVLSHPMSRKVTWLLERITDTSSGMFRDRYKDAFEQYWPTVKGAAKELVRTLSEPQRNAKFWAVAERLLALEGRQRLRLCCQTRAERDALRDALLDEELINADDLESGRVQVTAYSQRAEHGTDSQTVTLLVSPPPPGKAALYLSGEVGAPEVLCYPFEVGRLKSNARRANADFAGAAHNIAALTTLTGRPLGASGVAPESEPQLTELGVTSGGAPDGMEHPDLIEELPGADAGFWESAAGLYDTELPLPEDGHEASGVPGEAHMARLLTFTDGPSMLLAEDADCTVVVVEPGAEPDVVTLHPGQLEPGMRIAVLPGSERGGLLAELMAAWDEGIALVRARYLPMYERALDAAVERHGLAGVAERVGLSRRAVQLWAERDNWPGAAGSLRLLLEASGDEEALRNQALIQDYFNRVRGAHRYIGRVLNDAVGETVLSDTRSHESISKLEALVGRDLTDLFDATSVLTVHTVSELRRAPAGVLGSFLDIDDPYLISKVDSW